jgi:hypothetical protein
VNQLGLVQPVDGLGQCVVVAVATAADLGFDAGFCQPFGVPDGNVLRFSIGVMNQLVRQLIHIIIITYDDEPIRSATLEIEALAPSTRLYRLATANGAIQPLRSATGP